MTIGITTHAEGTWSVLSIASTDDDEEKSDDKSDEEVPSA